MKKRFTLRQTLYRSGNFSDVIKLLLFLSVMLSASMAMADAYSVALQEIEQGNYAQAYMQLEPLAVEGHAEAQYLLGQMLIDEVLSEKDPQKGVYWLEQAVQNKHYQAAQTLSKMYLSGMIVPLDVKQGTVYMQLAEKYRTADKPAEECD